MILLEPSFEILHFSKEPEKFIEKCGRVCYKSEDKITDQSALKFCNMLKNKKHESVIEHCYATVRFIANRGFTHELVRHRLASYSQESTRYCNYIKKGVKFIIPPWLDLEPGRYIETFDRDNLWLNAMLAAETYYLQLLHEGWPPQQARGVLPIDLKTEIIMTANFREWMHVFELRCSEAAHPQMRELMIPLRKEFGSIFFEEK